MLPETLTMLPLYILSTIKSPAFKLLSATKVDAKIYEKQKIVASSMECLANWIYPRVYDVSDIGTDEADFGHTHEDTGYMVKPCAVPAKYGKVANF